MRLALNDIVVRRLASDRQQTFWDASLQGFGIRVTARGKKTWTLMMGRERRRITLGHYPKMSLAEARRKAHTYADAPTVTFADAMQSFMRLHHEQNNRRTTINEKRRTLSKFFLRPWGHRKLDTITKGDILVIIDAIEKPSIAISAYVAIRTFFTWATRRDLLQINPAATLVRPAKARSRDRVLSEEELSIVWKAASATNEILSRIIKLLILTGQRRNEITTLRRSWIRHGTITFPADVCKNGHEHTIPATAEVAALLDSALGSDLLFPVPRGGQFRAWGPCVDRFRDECGIAHWTLHDLRRTFATIHARIGTPPHVIERILNHQTGTLSAIAKVYNRYSYLDEMREAMLHYEREVQRIFTIERT